MGVTQVKSGFLNGGGTVAFDAGVAAGVAVWVITDNQTIDTPTVSDDQTNTYSSVVSIDIDSRRIDIRRCTTSASGTLTLTFGGTLSYCRIYLLELDDDFAVDDYSEEIDIFSEPTGSAVTAVADGMAIGVVYASTGTQTPDAGWTELVDNNAVIVAARDTTTGNNYTMGTDASAFSWLVWTFVLSAGAPAGQPAGKRFGGVQFGPGFVQGVSGVKGW